MLPRFRPQKRRGLPCKPCELMVVGVPVDALGEDSGSELADKDTALEEEELVREDVKLVVGAVDTMVEKKKKKRGRRG
ncbi:hypothetical protein ColTof4_11768 [Colletotrichum tofieldiae]|nr:hypothetical protein ColTof3_03157 [Colletotrichum tofieldiae]GKT79345.1 hypothetical protein ColTof4_11768 [Colletotrichum tofieldiae]